MHDTMTPVNCSASFSIDTIMVTMDWSDFGESAIIRVLQEIFYI